MRWGYHRCDMVKRPRYIVVGVTGHSIHPGVYGGGSTGGSRPGLTSYSVLDTYCCHREVFRSYVKPTGMRGWSDNRRKEQCDEHAARLNTLEEVSA